MLGTRELNEISKKVYSNPKELLNYDLSSEDLSSLSRRVYNISLTDPKGKDYLLALKFNAVSFDENTALDLNSNPLEKASNLLWFGYTGKEGIYNIVKGNALDISSEININSIIGKKTNSTKKSTNKVSSVSDLLKDAYKKANNQNKKSLQRKDDGKTI